MAQNELKSISETSFSSESLATDAREVSERHEANRIAWNEGAAHYTARLEETLAFLRTGGSTLHPIEKANLGDLKAWCNTAIHLQCASGCDTLSLWNEGVKRIIGIDISDVHIINALRLSEALLAPATWYRCDVLETPQELDGCADLVYTGRGALCWLHDLNGWADVIFRLLKSGGIFHLFDDHPVTWLFDGDSTTYVASGLNYFTHSESSRGWHASYIGDLGKPIDKHARKYERLWPVSEVFQALRRAGLNIEHFGEHPDKYWEYFPNLRLELAGKIPMTFSLLARRP
ncbi:MAG: class I SAM-dependent methyltransferase [Acidobacteria bacterium]|nr:class I SAM-dependent methyltransferase [Acidobacteriota bacterium]